MALRSIAAAAFVGLSSAAIAADEVLALPGWTGPLLSRTWSGYLNIPGGKHLHYLFTESLTNPANAPVVLWLNGGPGCSSLEGLFAENGLYHIVTDTSTLYANPYSWGNTSNLLYIEAPAGVGFSYADTAAGLQHNDTGTAADNLAALQYFFAGFPEYAANDFFVSGESYAGIYVPSLSYDIVQYNKAGGGKIPLKGILVGNGCLGNEVGHCSGDPTAAFWDIEQWRGHGLISYKTYAAVLKACGDFVSPPDPNGCNTGLNDASDEVGHINVYDVYGPCITNFSVSSQQELDEAAASIAAGIVPTKVVKHYNKRPLRAAEKALKARLGGPDGCIDAGDLEVYLNQPAVIAALHVVTGIPWVVCTGNISYSSDIADERQVIYPGIVDAGVRVLVFNGETDACVPFQDNEAWTTSMNYSVVAPWTAWYVDANNVGGYVTQYANSFTFATVRGAGHMVPQYQPQSALTLFDTFVNNLPWPTQ